MARHDPPPEITIGELAERSGVPTSALRFYERQGLIDSRRTAGNQRRYARATLRRVAFIRAAHHLGIPLSVVGEVLALLPPGRPRRGSSGCAPRRAGARSSTRGSSAWSACATGSPAASAAAACPSRMRAGEPRRRAGRRGRGGAAAVRRRHSARLTTRPAKSTTTRLPSGSFKVSDALVSGTATLVASRPYRCSTPSARSARTTGTRPPSGRSAEPGPPDRASPADREGRRQGLTVDGQVGDEGGRNHRAQPPK